MARQRLTPKFRGKLESPHQQIEIGISDSRPTQTGHRGQQNSINFIRSHFSGHRLSFLRDRCLVSEIWPSREREIIQLLVWIHLFIQKTASIHLPHIYSFKPMFLQQIKKRPRFGRTKGYAVQDLVEAWPVFCDQQLKRHGSPIQVRKRQLKVF
jgi:hypothetical protein